MITNYFASVHGNIQGSASSTSLLNMFSSDTGIQITTEGRRYLGSAVESPKSYVSEKVKEWTNEISKLLCEFADTQPHAVFSALTHDLLGRWIYLFRVLPNINELFSPLEQCIRMQLLPTLTGKCVFSDLERQFRSRLGGLGILNPLHLVLLNLILH